MLAARVDAEIRRLIAAGLPQRKIAARLGVSRTTVQAVATHRRKRGGRINNRLDRPHLATAPDALPERCGGCGGLVYKPCILCRALRHQATQAPEEKSPIANEAQSED